MSACDFASLKVSTLPGTSWCEPRRLDTPKTSRLVADHVWRIALGSDDFWHCVLCGRQPGDRYGR